VLAAAVFLAASAAQACDTPVFRYAMYNWATSPYWVFYLHSGEEAEEDQKTNKFIEDLASPQEGAATNILLERMDVSKEETLERLPGVVKEAWQSYKEGATPAHVVIAPWGAKLFVGRLDEPAIRAMIESPARTRLGELLNEGNAAVMLFLSGSKAEENQKAEDALKDLTTRITGGEIPLISEFDDPVPTGLMPPETLDGKAEAQDAEAAEEKPGGLKVAVLKIDRSDKAEAWFVRTLMAVEPDLGEYVEEPMIFAGYGRGRAMEPYIGKGITGDNLIDVVAFLAGACSCQVKEQNPGADLLMRWDWEKTADLWAADDPAFDDGPMFYQEFPAEKTEETEMAADSTEEPATPAESETASSSEAQPAAPAAAEVAEQKPPIEAVAMVDAPSKAEPAQETPPQTITPPTDAPLAGTDSAEAAAGDRPAPADADSDSASASVDHSTTRPADAPQSFARNQMRRIGFGLAVAAALLVVVSLVVIMRRA
jgi:hypothetical protein